MFEPNYAEVPNYKPEPVETEEAANDEVFGEPEAKSFQEMSKEELFGRRKAHELILKQGWRDKKHDLEALDAINTEMTTRRLTDADYQAFLETYPTPQ